MIDTRTNKGKLHLILDLIDREDLRHQLEQELTDAQQENLFESLSKSIAEEAERLRINSIAH